MRFGPTPPDVINPALRSEVTFPNRDPGGDSKLTIPTDVALRLQGREVVEMLLLCVPGLFDFAEILVGCCDRKWDSQDHRANTDVRGGTSAHVSAFWTAKGGNVCHHSASQSRVLDVIGL